MASKVEKADEVARSDERCVRRAATAAASNGGVAAMLRGLARHGCVVDTAALLQCRPCPAGRIGGYFDPDEGIVMCSDHVRVSLCATASMRLIML